MAATKRIRRDRRGRGLRGLLAPSNVPLAHTRADAFDALVLQAVDHLRPQIDAELAGMEFAVEDVPPIAMPGSAGSELGYDSDVLDDSGVPLSRIYRTGIGHLTVPVIVLYRRPLESRVKRGRNEAELAGLLDLADLIHDVVVEQVARLLGRAPEDIDPPAD